MRLLITYQTKENRFRSFEVNCHYRRQGLTAAFNKADYKSLHSVVRLKEKPIRYGNFNGCHDDYLQRVKY